MGNWKKVAVVLAAGVALLSGPVAASALPALPPLPLPGPAACDWPMFGRDLGRSFSAPGCSTVNTLTTPTLHPKWRVDTSSPVSAQPAVVGGVVYVGTAGGTFYAVDAATGTVKWTYTVGDKSSNSYGKIVSSAAVADVDGTRAVLFGGGATLYALDAAKGTLLASSCVDPDAVRNCGPGSQTVEIESSPAVVPIGSSGGARVLVGMDFNEQVGVGRAGLLSFHLHNTGTGWKLSPQWKYDPETLLTYTTDPLHEGGKGNSCGNIWSSPTVDLAHNLVISVTGNCDKNPPFEPGAGESIFGVSLDTGALVWRHAPRSPDNGLDFDFGATPNVLPSGNVGEGGKDGNYYSIPLTGNGTPDWVSRVSTGSDIGGMIGSTALGQANGKPAVFASTAIPISTRDPQTSFQMIAGDPRLATGLHAIDAATGKKLWDAPTGPAYGAAVYSGGVVFIPDTFTFTVQAFDANTGVPLWAFPMQGPPASPPAIVGNSLYLGSGISFGPPLDSIGAIWGFQTAP
ncbi:MAG: PQQ-like domain [Acidimicrobiales bacterium]|nr:PQQ-like domain [Acidimicrobiales bacterium]